MSAVRLKHILFFIDIMYSNINIIMNIMLGFICHLFFMYFLQFLGNVNTAICAKFMSRRDMHEIYVATYLLVGMFIVLHPQWSFYLTSF